MCRHPSEKLGELRGLRDEVTHYVINDFRPVIEVHAHRGLGFHSPEVMSRLLHMVPNPDLCDNQEEGRIGRSYEAEICAGKIRSHVCIRYFVR